MAWAWALLAMTRPLSSSVTSRAMRTMRYLDMYFSPLELIEMNSIRTRTERDMPGHDQSFSQRDDEIEDDP